MRDEYDFSNAKKYHENKIVLAIKDQDGVIRVHPDYFQLYEEALTKGDAHVEVLVKQLRDQMEALKDEQQQ